MPQSLAQVHIHLVFSTKNRAPVIHDEIRESLHRYMATVLKNHKCRATLINSVEDHVHILFELHRTVTLSSAAEAVKKSSSIWIKTQGAEFANFAWQGGYGAFAVSKSGLPGMIRYITNQKEHHQKFSFQDELRAILSEQGIEFDERYLWD